MLKHWFLDAEMINSDPASVTFKTSEGESIQINKYFLFLYDAFYQSVLNEIMVENIVFIFEGVTLNELILLREQIYRKHLQCGAHSHLAKENQLKESEADPNIDGKTQDTGENKDDLENSENISSDGSLILACPFKCDEVPEGSWTVDTLFAHIFSKHRCDVKNNFFVSIDTFIDKLGSELSSFKCALKCERSVKNYSDLRALKTHYHRCHEEDPVICSNCGESFQNSIAHSAHNQKCHVDKKECDLCPGKTFKNLYQHVYWFHNKERKLECEAEGCSLKFRDIFDLRTHTRVVHNKEKPFVCDKCGIKMAQMHNLKVHRIKVHREKNLTFKEYKEMVRSGQHSFLPSNSEIPIAM